MLSNIKVLQKNFLFAPSWQFMLEKQVSSWIMGYLSLILLLLCSKHQHVWLSQISNRFCEVTGIPAEWNFITEIGLQSPVWEMACLTPPPTPPTHTHTDKQPYRVGASEVVVAWHGDDIDALLFLLAWKIACPCFSQAQTLEKERTPNCF